MATSLEMSNTSLLSLPDLMPKQPWSERVPRRYEETKPAALQGMSHHRILRIGHGMHQKLVGEWLAEKERDLQAREEALRKEAERAQKELLLEAERRARLELERTLKKLRKEHEINLKKERRRVEAEMRVWAMNQVLEERAAGEKRLKETVERLEREFQEKLEKEVLAARTEEREYAAEQARIAAEKARLELEEALRKAAEEKARALDELTRKLNREKDIALREMYQREQDEARLQLANQKFAYEQLIANLQAEFTDVKEILRQTQEELHNMKRARMDLQEELLETRAEFDKFINIVRPYQKCFHTEFVLPPVRCPLLEPEEMDEL